MDKKQCRYTDENGQVQNPSLNACAEAVSAVKAIQIAASQGQKVYTVNASNASAALAASGAGGEIKEAIQAGMEVTFHERSINAHGWSGTGYSIVDPETGVGSYLIEGKGNGGNLTYLDRWGKEYGGVSYGTWISLALFVTSLLAITVSLGGILLVLLTVLSLFTAIINALSELDVSMENGCPALGYLGASLEATAFFIALFKGAAGLALGNFIYFITGGAIGQAAKVCKK